MSCFCFFSAEPQAVNLQLSATFVACFTKNHKNYLAKTFGALPSVFECKVRAPCAAKMGIPRGYPRGWFRNGDKKTESFHIYIVDISFKIYNLAS